MEKSNVQDLPQPIAESTRLSTKWIHESNSSEELTHTALPSFNISESFQDPLSDPEPEHPQLVPELTDQPLIRSQDNISFEIIENGTQRSNKLLVDSNGYSYTMKSHKHSRSDRVVWCCTLRRKTITCSATVIQIGEVFTPGPNDHIHPAQPGIDIKVKITKKVHQIAKVNVFRSASAIVEDMMSTDFQLEKPSISRPKPSNLIRSSNHKNRPTEPQDILFDLFLNWIPQDSFQGDIKVHGARHIFFASLPQLNLLNNASVIYCDATFKVVRQPFCQLFSLHSFLADDNGYKVKQVPLAFVMMSRRRKREYKAIFQHIKEIIPSINLFRLITDFEAAIWNGAREVFPNIIISGCNFHWGQALWRKVQELGLAVSYRTVGSVNEYIKLLFALPFIPEEHILPSFIEIAACATPDIQPLIEYMDRTWMTGAMWSPADWCVFKRAIRSNNDVEGWHNRLNTRAQHSNISFYILISLLHSEAVLIPIQQKLVHEDKIHGCKYGTKFLKKFPLKW